MNLLEAFKRAKHAISPDRNDAQRRHVLVDGASVVACDGEVTTYYTLDDDVGVSAAISADQIGSLIQTAKAITHFDWNPSGSTISIKVVNDGGGQAGGTFNVLPASQFKKHSFGAPSHAMEVAVDENPLPFLVDFVGDDPSVPQYAYIKVTAEGGQATDQKSAAYVSIDTPWQDMLLPARLFTRWPKASQMEMSGVDHGALVKLGSEIRYAPQVKRDGFPDVEGKLFSGCYEEPAIVVSTKALASAIKQGTGCSAVGIVWLNHTPTCLSVNAETNKGGHAYSSDLQGDGFGRSKERYAFDGKRVLKALKSCKTPNVLISCPHENAPLRIESGALVAVVWSVDMEEYSHGQSHS